MKTTGVLAILAVAICLIPAGAHLFEMNSKLAMTPEDYMTTQAIYAGWAWFGVPIFTALCLTLAHGVLAWPKSPAWRLSLLSFLLILATQAIFWIFTYPMSALTQNWMVRPADFEMARRQWEYSHAANAVLTGFALIAIVIDVVGAARRA